MNTLVLGIDNGLSGGLVWLRGQEIVAAMAMPTAKLRAGKKDWYDGRAIRDAIAGRLPTHAVLEKAQAMTTRFKDKSTGEVRNSPQGGVSNFTTGYGFGLMEGLLIALDIPYTTVHPKTWQASLFRDMPKGCDTKAMATQVAGRLWPGFDFRASPRCRKSHSGIVDAALIAEHGRRALAILR